MKHGHKKGKAKASASGKKSTAAAKRKTGTGSSAQKSSAKAARPAGKSGGEALSFNNPVVATAFRRAVKKYPSAFRRLTD
jgi:autotransporter adhesin